MKLSIGMVGAEESLLPGRLRKVEPAEARICEQVKDLMFSSHGIALVNRRWQAARPIQLDHRLFSFSSSLSQRHLVDTQKTDIDEHLMNENAFR